MTLKAPNSNTKLKVKIKVICRVRPVMKGEREDGTVKVDRTQKTISIVNQRQPEEVLKYGFDNCYDMTGTQQEIYSENLLPILKDVFKGMDATVFCYGMTGAGKTHTIQGTSEDPGLIPRCMKDIFEYRDKFLTTDTTTSQSNGRPHTFEVRVSYMEIYLETVFDLLRPRDKNSRAGLAIREDANRNVFVSGLEISLINSYEEFQVEYSKGCKNRATAVTLLNQASSRSHAILGIEIKIEDATTGKSFRSKLNLIDLAGSEDNRRTGNTNLRLNESSSINQSLHALGKVVDAINNRASQIPYRDSKMTRILQSTLGGRSLGMMIVNIAPGKVFFPETHRALNFATKSKEIVNNTVFNETTEPNIVRNVNLETLQAVKPTIPRSDSQTIKSTILKPLALKRKSLSVNSLKPLDPQTSADDKVMQDLASSLPLTAKSGNAKALIEMAHKFLTEQRTEDAYRCYKHALIFAPNNPVALNAIHKLDSEELKSSIKLETKDGLIKRTFSGLTRRTTTTPSPNKKLRGVTLDDSLKLNSTPPDPNPSAPESYKLPVKVDTDATSGFVKKFVPRRRLTKVEEGTVPDQDQRNLSSTSETFHSNLSLPNQSRPLRSADVSRSMTDVLASSPEVTPIAKRKIKPLTTQVLSDCSFFSDVSSPVEPDPSYSDFIVLSDDDDDSDDSLVTTPLKPKRKPPARKSLKPDSQIPVLEDPTRVQELKGILVDPEHPLVALVNMGNPDLLKGLWPHGLKTRQLIANFIKSVGPITALQDLIPTAITEKVLLKSLAKLQP